MRQLVPQTFKSVFLIERQFLTFGELVPGCFQVAQRIEAVAGRGECLGIEPESSPAVRGHEIAPAIFRHHPFDAVIGGELPAALLDAFAKFRIRPDWCGSF